MENPTYPRPAEPSVVATATDRTVARTYSGSWQKVVAHDVGSAPDGARIAALTHATRWLELRIAAPLAVVARVNMGDAHDVRGGSNGVLVVTQPAGPPYRSKRPIGLSAPFRHGNGHVRFCG
jgi:hypothetical protein